MSQNKAIVRELVERIEGVAGTWFELEIEGASRKKTLVVEVGFDLDPNSAHFLRTACDEIERTFNAVVREENGDVVSKLRIVNKAGKSAEKHSAEKHSAEKHSAEKHSPEKHSPEKEHRSQRVGTA